jgi:hypothetical protein
LVFPNISFEEIDQTPRQLSPATTNRIGVVGRFLKGPRNVFQLIDAASLAKKYGKTGREFSGSGSGSIAIQTAADQGANDFGVVRVMGSGLNSGAYLKFDVENTNVIGVSETVTVYSTAFKIPFVGNGVDKSIDVANDFAAVMRKGLFDFSDVSTDGNIVTIRTSNPNALNMPIRFAMRTYNIDPQNPGNDSAQSNTKISIRYAEQASLLRVDAGGTIALAADTSLSSEIRLINGSISLRFDVTATANSSARIHVLLGADAITQKNITDAPKLVEALIANANARHLGFSLQPLTLDPEALLIRTGIEDALEGDSSKFLVTRVSNEDSTPVDTNLVMQTKIDSPGVDFEALNAGAISKLGGAIQGPKRAFETVRLFKFIRSEITATVAKEGVDADKKTKISLTGGEIALGDSGNLSLGNLDIVVSNEEDKIIYAYKDNSGTLKLSMGATTYRVREGEIKLGTYTKGVPGVFTPAPVVNGDVLMIEANAEGAWGNNIQANVSYGTDGNITVVLSYSDNYSDNQISEPYSFKLTDDGVLDDGQYPMVVATKNSDIARIFYVGKTPENKSASIATFNGRLTRGYDGPDPSIEDWVKAIKVLGQNQANIIIASGNSNPRVRSELIAQAESSDEVTGLRIAVLSADRRLSVPAARELTQNLDSKYAVMVAGHCSYSKRNDLAPLSVPPDGFYAGHLAMTPFQISPAARSSSPAFIGVSAVDVQNPGTLSYNEFTKARVEMIIPDQVTGVFHCLNGLSLSKETSWKWISLRRTYNYIRSNAFARLQFAKSEPNNSALRENIKLSLRNLLYLMKSAGEIENFSDIKVDDENNPPAQAAAGILRVDIFFTPVYPADFIKVGLHRSVVPVSLTVATGTV